MSLNLGFSDNFSYNQIGIVGLWEQYHTSQLSFLISSWMVSATSHFPSEHKNPVDTFYFLLSQKNSVKVLVGPEEETVWRHCSELRHLLKLSCQCDQWQCLSIREGIFVEFLLLPYRANSLSDEAKSAASESLCLSQGWGSAHLQ